MTIQKIITLKIKNPIIRIPKEFLPEDKSEIKMKILIDKKKIIIERMK